MLHTSRTALFIALSLAGVASATAQPDTNQAMADLFPHTSIPGDVSVQGKMERVQFWRSATFQWHHQKWKLFLVQGMPFTGGKPADYQAASAWISGIWYKKTGQGWEPAGRAYNFATDGDYGKAQGKSGPFPHVFVTANGVMLTNQNHYMAQGTQGFNQNLFIFTGSHLRETSLISGLNNVGACGDPGSSDCLSSNYQGRVTSVDIAPNGKVSHIVLQYHGFLANRPLPATTCAFRELPHDHWQTIGSCMPYTYQQKND
jgi:hypothetical protein